MKYEMLGIFFLIIFSVLTASSASEKKITFDGCGAEKSKYVCQPESLTSENTAVVIVDIWEHEWRNNFNFNPNLVNTVRSFRQNNFFLIHGAGDSILAENSYKELKKEVMQFLGNDYCKKNYTFGSENRKKIYGYLATEDNCNATSNFRPNEKLFRGVLPTQKSDREFFVRHEDEFRYVLWKNKIKNIIYVGGAFELCLFQRPYGVNFLRGMESKMLDVNIYLIDSLIDIMPNASLNIDDDLRKKVLLTGLTYNILKIIPYPSLKFQSEKE